LGISITGEGVARRAARKEMCTADSHFAVNPVNGKTLQQSKDVASFQLVKNCSLPDDSEIKVSKQNTSTLLFTEIVHISKDDVQISEDGQTFTNQSRQSRIRFDYSLMALKILNVTVSDAACYCWNITGLGVSLCVPFTVGQDHKLMH
jgi:hypothetical protein